MGKMNFTAETKGYQPLLDLIEHSLYKDQGNRYRHELEQIISAQQDVFQQKNMQFRSHLGASLLGRPCKRQTWYSFRWAKESKFDGRMIRLFNRGHMEETRFIAILRQAGLLVWFTDQNGGQFVFNNCDGHYGGSLDAVVRGVPGYENIPMLGEFKTHSDDSFHKLKTLGVKAAKSEHYTQMNQYAGHYKLTHMLYMAVNKNNDELYVEVVEFDQEDFDHYINVANLLVKSDKPPMRISKDPTYFMCKRCEYNDICHKNKLPQRTCRTCKNAVRMSEGKWICLNTSNDLTKEMQYNACSEYALLETL
jgi:hypothetical protein